MYFATLTVSSQPVPNDADKTMVESDWDLAVLNLDDDQFSDATEFTMLSDRRKSNNGIVRQAKNRAQRELRDLGYTPYILRTDLAMNDTPVIA